MFQHQKCSDVDVLYALIGIAFKLVICNDQFRISYNYDYRKHLK